MQTPKSLLGFLTVTAVSCASVLTALTAHADLVIKQELEGGPGPKQTVTMSVKGKVARIDSGEMGSALIDGEKGTVTNILHAQKMYMVMSKEQLTQTMKMAGQMQKEGKTESTKPASTGKKEKIGEYETEEYVQKIAGNEVHYWIAKDYPNFKSYAEQMSQFQNSELAKMAQDAGVPNTDPKDLPGMPIRTVISLNGQTITTTTVSVEEKKLDESIFAAPKDYQKMEMPAIPGAGGAAPAGGN